MKIAIDLTPLEDKRILSHRVRGSGFYLQNLKRSLLKYYPENEYIFFSRGQKIGKKVDLIHYPYFEPFFLTLPFLNSTKKIITVHDLTPLVFPKEFPRGLKGELKWQAQKFNLRKAEGVITDSFASNKDLIKFGEVAKGKISVAYLAAGEEFRKLYSSPKIDGWREKTFKKYDLPEAFVLYVGDATWNKNLPRLIRTIKEINLTLVMVGKTLVEKNYDKTNPWNKDLVHIHKEADDDKRIMRLGFVPTEDLVALYNCATVFVMPSLYEGFGLPILEAMQSGCPVVTTKAGSLSEVAGDAAFFVDEYDEKSIANGIGEVYFTKKLQQELSAKGLQQAKKFSWKKTAEKTIAAYKEIINK